MDKDMIEMLQKNEIPFGLLCPHIQEIMKKTGKESFLYFNSSGNWIEPSGYKEFDKDLTYRLKPDYKEPPKFLEYKIDSYTTMLGKNKAFRYVDSRGIIHTITFAAEHPDFIGFKYANGKVTAALRMYEKKGTYYSKDMNNIKDGCIVHTPTHVVFRE